MCPFFSPHLLDGSLFIEVWAHIHEIHKWIFDFGVKFGRNWWLNSIHVRFIRVIRKLHYISYALQWLVCLLLSFHFDDCVLIPNFVFRSTLQFQVWSTRILEWNCSSKCIVTSFDAYQFEHEVIFQTIPYEQWSNGLEFDIWIDWTQSTASFSLLNIFHSVLVFQSSILITSHFHIIFMEFQHLSKCRCVNIFHKSLFNLTYHKSKVHPLSSCSLSN